MKILKYITLLMLPLLIIAGCKKDQMESTSLVSSITAAGKLAVMFDITHDNTGVVTITPNGEGAVSYDVYFGDGNATPVTVNAGKNIKHTYAEGNYQVKLVAHDLKGGTTTLTQPLVVAFVAPQNLIVKVNTMDLNVTVSATAKYATFFKIYFGDSTTVVPEPYYNALADQVISHNYAAAGTYVIRVLALSGGSETAQFLDTVTVAPPALKQVSLPITFDDPTVDYSPTDFGGAASNVVVDPTDAGNHVMQSIKTNGAQTYAGVILGVNGFATPIPLTTSSEKLTVRVYSPAAGVDVKLKLDNHANANNGLSVETDVLTTKANQWETLTFDMSKNAAGTPAFNPSNTYDMAVMFFDFGNTGTGATYYFDDMQIAAPPVMQQIDLPVTFDNANVDYSLVDFGGNVSSIVADPTDASNHVAMSVKTSGAATYAGTTMGANGFATAIPLSTTREKMTVRVYSPAAGIDVKLKLDNKSNANNGQSVETDVLTTKANQWETLTFDLSQNSAGTPAFNPANTYNLATIFFDFGNGGSGATYYWDNVVLL